MYVHDSAYIYIKQVRLKNIDRIYLNYNQRQQHKGNLVVIRDGLKGSVIELVSLSGTKGFEYLPIRLNAELGTTDLFFQFTGQTDNCICEVDGFLLGEELPGEENSEYESVYKQIDSLLNASPKNTTPIMIEKPSNRSRQTNVFV